MFLRRSLEVATRRIVFRRHFPARFGGRAFYASTEGGLRYFRFDLNRVDPVLLQAASRLINKGDCVWDVGANVGLFSFAASGLAGARGKVYAFEPDTKLVNLLQRSARITSPGCAPVSVVPVAISNDVALRQFCIAKRARAMNFLTGFGCSQTGGVRESYIVLTASLDWFLGNLPAPDVLKIDTEGAELAVLQGAWDLLSVHRPKIIIEVADENASEVSKLLFSLGYELFDLADPEHPIDRATWNTLAIPVTKSDSR